MYGKIGQEFHLQYSDGLMGENEVKKNWNSHCVTNQTKTFFNDTREIV